MHGSDRNTLRRVHLYHEHNILPIFLPPRTLTLSIRNCRSIKMTMQWRLQISGTPSNQMDSTRSLDRQRSVHNYQRCVSSCMFRPNFKILRFITALGSYLLRGNLTYPRHLILKLKKESRARQVVRWNANNTIRTNKKVANCVSLSIVFLRWSYGVVLYEIFTVGKLKPVRLYYT